MMGLGFKTNNGSVYDFKFDEQRIINENNLNGFFEQTVFDNLKDNPDRKNESKLYNYGNGGWCASGTIFGQVIVKCQILFDPDKNKSQNGLHFNIQGIVNVSGSQPYSVPVGGNVHRIYSNELQVIFYNFNGTVSGTKTLTFEKLI